MAEIPSRQERELFVDALIRKLYPYADSDWCLVIENPQGGFESAREYWINHFDSALAIEASLNSCPNHI